MPPTACRSRGVSFRLPSPYAEGREGKDFPNHLESFLCKHPQLLEQIVELVGCGDVVLETDPAPTALQQASSSAQVLDILRKQNQCYPESLRTVATQTIAVAIATRLGSTVTKVCHSQPRAGRTHLRSVLVQTRLLVLDSPRHLCVCECRF